MNTLERGGRSNPQETERQIGRRIIRISPRDRDILTRKSQGEIFRDQATQMPIAESTIKHRVVEITKKFGTTSTNETLKQAVILGVVRDVPTISDEQLSVLTSRECAVLDAAYKQQLDNNITEQLARTLSMSQSTLKRSFSSLSNRIGTNRVIETVLRYARTIEPPEQKTAIVCIQEEDGDVTEQQIRLLEVFAKQESGTGKGRPDYIEQRMHVLRNGGTIDITEQPLNALAMLTFSTELQTINTEGTPETLIWPAVRGR